jgi:hypothetical protein
MIYAFVSKGTKAKAEGQVVDEFLHVTTASQLTYHGLQQLHETMREREQAVFFRNNHFSVIFKNNGRLFLLVTDLGYKNEPDFVWERLCEVNGDSG